jgi:hypothetical protein
MQTFTVLKTVEYLYTVEAESADEAERLVNDYGTIEANHWTVLDISAESDDEYESSIEG